MATEQHDVRVRSLAGRFLVASPHADGSPYRRTVMLLLEHNENGATGVILDGSFSASLQQARAQLPNVLAGTNRQTAASAAVPVRVTIWEPGLLDLEVASGLWLTTPADPQRLLSGDVPDWASLVREVGRSLYRDALGIKEFPRDAYLN